MSMFYVLKKTIKEDEENPLRVNYKQKQMNLPIYFKCRTTIPKRNKWPIQVTFELVPKLCL